MQVTLTHIGDTHSLFLAPENDYEERCLKNFVEHRDAQGIEHQWCKTCPQKTLLLKWKEV